MQHKQESFIIQYQQNVKLSGRFYTDMLSLFMPVRTNQLIPPPLSLSLSLAQVTDTETFKKKCKSSLSFPLSLSSPLK